MNLSGRRKSVKGQRGFTVMEMFVYVILFAAFLSFAYRAVTASSRGIGVLQNNTYEIIRVTRAGERWRQDIRDAVSTPEVKQTSELDQSFSSVEQITSEDGVEGLGIDGNHVPCLAKIHHKTKSSWKNFSNLWIGFNVHCTSHDHIPFRRNSSIINHVENQLVATFFSCFGIFISTSSLKTSSFSFGTH